MPSRFVYYSISISNSSSSCFVCADCGFLFRINHCGHLASVIQRRQWNYTTKHLGIINDANNVVYKQHFCGQFTSFRRRASNFSLATRSTSSHFGFNARAHTPRPYNLIEFKFDANNETTATDERNETKKKKKMKKKNAESSWWIDFRPNNNEMRNGRRAQFILVLSIFESDKSIFSRLQGIGCDYCCWLRTMTNVGRAIWRPSIISGEVVWTLDAKREHVLFIDWAFESVFIAASFRFRIK